MLSDNTTFLLLLITLMIHATNTIRTFEPLDALAFGIFAGILIQGVASRLRYQDEWAKLPFSKKLAMSLSGGVAAGVVGLYLLANPDPNANPDVPFMYNLWLWQSVAAWLGAVLLDAASQILRMWVESKGGSTPNDDDNS